MNLRINLTRETISYSVVIFLVFFCVVNGTETGKTALNESISTPKVPQQVLIDASTSAEDLENEHDVTNKASTWDLDQLVLPTPPGYRKWDLPVHSHKKWRVYAFVSIFIRAILEVNEKDEEVILDTDFGLQWVDWKIFEHLKNSSSSNGEINFQHRTLDSTVLRHIWKPDVFIDEMSSAERTSVISNLITLNFLGGKNGGDIVYSARTTLKLRCDMSFEYYPADIQTCKYYIRSYSYNASQFDILWNVYEGSISKGIYLNDPSDPNFDLQISYAGPTGSGKLYVQEMFDDFRSGNYSALTFTLKMRRKLSYHLVQTYLPSVLLILITWLCFLLPVDMVEARIGISMTSGLTLTAMFAAVRQQSPSVSYSMAIDQWMVFCIFFVFLGLLLFTIIYWMTKHLEKYEEEQVATPNYKKFIIEFIQRYAFLAFAAIFISFFVIYWSWLLLSSNYFDWEPNPDYNGGDDDDDAKNNTNLYSYFETTGDEYAKSADEGMNAQVMNNETSES